MGLFDRVKSTLRSDGDETTDSGADEEPEVSGAFEVPAWAVEDRVNVEERTGIIHEHYDEVNKEQARVIAEKLKEDMADTSGYTMDSIRYDLEDTLDLPDELIYTIVWTETSSIELMDTVSGYLDDDAPRYSYKISVSDDDRTHSICREAAREIEEQSGVGLEELTRILITKAEKYKDEGGTPERMEHWVPHERCRHSVVRQVDL